MWVSWQMTLSMKICILANYFFVTALWSLLVLDDHSRVKLENSENDYINASLVMVEEAQRAYILSQVRRHTSIVNICTNSSEFWSECMLNKSASYVQKNVQDLTWWAFLCFASTGAFKEYLWSFLADDLGAMFQSCYNAQQSHWKGICEYILAPADFSCKTSPCCLFYSSSGRHVTWRHIFIQTFRALCIKWLC